MSSKMFSFSVKVDRPMPVNCWSRLKLGKHSSVLLECAANTAARWMALESWVLSKIQFGK